MFGAASRNDSAAVITERAINFVRPQAVFFVGIAGSLKPDVSPGDVVVASEVYAYHGGKESAEGFKGRPRSWETTHHLQQVQVDAYLPASPANPGEGRRPG
ncbi:hypothetical protein [Streptomyces sp. NPDC001980]|uniref:5'-methylthioadenosine/S-adenosylhomocysteine nucleosidase family protein n=1 Tax=Streptomyces sp. NPDC001980 TaxID=3157126 RepID=UPI00332BA7BE